MVGDNIECDVAAPIRLGMRGIRIAPDAEAGRGDSGVVADAILPDLPDLPALAKLLAGITDR
jgi:FMN phosphatase YigB (HAD superfamily)